MTLRVELRPRARRELERLPRDAQERIVRALRALADGARGDVVKLAGIEPPEWRLRVGAYRVRFRRGAEGLDVLRVADRRDAYR